MTVSNQGEEYSPQSFCNPFCDSGGDDAVSAEWSVRPVELDTPHRKNSQGGPAKLFLGTKSGNVKNLN
ncbi:unnamed protein product, partial [marine sediment metagenome]